MVPGPLDFLVFHLVEVGPQVPVHVLLRGEEKTMALGFAAAEFEAREIGQSAVVDHQGVAGGVHHLAALEPAQEVVLDGATVGRNCLAEAFVERHGEVPCRSRRINRPSKGPIPASGRSPGLLDSPLGKERIDDPIHPVARLSGLCHDPGHWPVGRLLDPETTLHRFDDAFAGAHVNHSPTTERGFLELSCCVVQVVERSNF